MQILSLYTIFIQIKFRITQHLYNSVVFDSKENFIFLCVFVRAKDVALLTVVTYLQYSGLLKMTVGVLTTCHAQYTIQEYVVAPMDQEILRVFLYNVRCAVVMHFSAWSTVY
jgi:hypothetical protein